MKDVSNESSSKHAGTRRAERTVSRRALYTAPLLIALTATASQAVYDLTDASHCGFCHTRYGQMGVFTTMLMHCVSCSPDTVDS